MKGKDKYKYGFPFKCHASKEATFCPSSGRWEYFRPRHVDRNTVSYHPLILLLWGAHCNLMRITATAWCYYILKYAGKCEPTGRLCLDLDAAKRLGIQGVGDTQLKAIATMRMSKPVSASTAAVTLLQIDTITKSSEVTKISSVPPALRMRFVSAAKNTYLPPVDKYCARPSILSTITFVDYFRKYAIEKNKKKRQTPVGRDQLGNYIYFSSHIVRFTNYHPAHHTEAYFYNVLLNNVPFVSEAELLSHVSINPLKL
jgi:hypothetical protein